MTWWFHRFFQELNSKCQLDGGSTAKTETKTKCHFLSFFSISEVRRGRPKGKSIGFRGTKIFHVVQWLFKIKMYLILITKRHHRIKMQLILTKRLCKRFRIFLTNPLIFFIRLYIITLNVLAKNYNKNKISLFPLNSQSLLWICCNF